MAFEKGFVDVVARSNGVANSDVALVKQFRQGDNVVVNYVITGVLKDDNQAIGQALVNSRHALEQHLQRKVHLMPSKMFAFFSL